jgi:hypothetical protein
VLHDAGESSAGCAAGRDGSSHPRQLRIEYVVERTACVSK